MIPKFRVWDKEADTMHDVTSIWFDRNNEQYKLGHVSFPSQETVDTIFDNFELMQSTGLKDKNGVEIFEGDIVLFTIEDGFDYVYGKPGRINLSLQWGAGVRASSGGNYPLRKCREVRIIGNIYENPELLEAIE